MTIERAKTLADTYRHARMAAGAARQLGPKWASIRRAMTKTAWQVRAEMRGAPMRAASYF